MRFINFEYLELDSQRITGKFKKIEWEILLPLNQNPNRTIKLTRGQRSRFIVNNFCFGSYDCPQLKEDILCLPGGHKEEDNKEFTYQFTTEAEALRVYNILCSVKQNEYKNELGESQMIKKEQKVINVEQAKEIFDVKNMYLEQTDKDCMIVRYYNDKRIVEFVREGNVLDTIKTTLFSEELNTEITYIIPEANPFIDILMNVEKYDTEKAFGYCIEKPKFYPTQKAIVIPYLDDKKFSKEEIELKKKELAMDCRIEMVRYEKYTNPETVIYYYTVSTKTGSHEVTDKQLMEITK